MDAEAITIISGVTLLARSAASTCTGSPARELAPRLRDCLAYATERHPELCAAFERWRASVHRISPARRLPDRMDIGPHAGRTTNTRPLAHMPHQRYLEFYKLKH